MTLDAASMAPNGKAAAGVNFDNAWHAAEAYHFWLLAHRQLYAGDMEAAMRTALNMRRYTDRLVNQSELAYFGPAVVCGTDCNLQHA